MGINKDQMQIAELDVESVNTTGQKRVQRRLLKAGDDLQIDIADNLGSMKSPFSMNQRESEVVEDDDHELKLINPSTPGSAVYIRKSNKFKKHNQDGDGDPNHNEVAAAGHGDEHCASEQITMSDYQRQKLQAPEKKLTLFAMRLAVLEKIASTVGTLGFIWATVVILGGYAITLKESDFWIVTIILVTEGTRIFMRSHELEWQHQDSGDGGGTIVSQAYHAFERAFSNLVGFEGRHKRKSTEQHHHLRRAWSNSANVSLVPFMGILFKAKRVSLTLYGLQIASAFLSIGLSVWRLVQHNFVRPTEVDTEKNHAAALFIFYSLTVAEAAVFLSERAYWQYQVIGRKLLQTTNLDCKLRDKDCYTVRRFFYDVYEKCLTKSVFDGLKMDLVDYALQWTQSDVLLEQLHGVKALVAFSSEGDKQMREETLRTISTRPGAVERLLEMTTWKNEEEQEVREKAALLLRILVNYDRTGVRVASVDGSVEAIFTLLNDESLAEGYSASAHEFAGPNAPARLSQQPRSWSHVRAGLHILINMAKNPINCAKLGATRGLLPCLISFIDVTKQAGAQELQAREEETVLALSLRLLSLLAACQGPPGRTLRSNIANILPSITNLRNILNMHPPNPHLQKLAAGTLSQLAMDAEVRQIIGRVGGVMRSLFSLFLKPEVGAEAMASSETQTPLIVTELEQRTKNKEMKVAIKAGHALSLLALQDKENCARMLRLKLPATAAATATDSANVDSPAAIAAVGRIDVIDALFGVLRDKDRGYLATFILYCLCDTGAIQQHHKDRVAHFFPEVMRLFMGKEEKVQEVAIGLVAKILKTIKMENIERVVLCDNTYSKKQIVDMIGCVLETHKLPCVHLPRIRRFCLELVIILTELDPSSFIPLFESINIVGHLDCIAATASDMENYATFSGAIGSVFLPITMEHLVQEAIDKLSLHDQISFS